MKVRRPIFAFNAGELSRRMEGRSDLDGIYDKAVAQMLNYVPAVEGPAMKRPGFRYIRGAATSASWLSKFVFNTTQSYVLEWSAGQVRFYTNDGRIEGNPSAPYYVDVPYSAAEAPHVSVKQSYDRLYCAHPNHPPAMLTRTDAQLFEYAEIPLKDGPFKDWNTDRAKTITWAGDGTVGGVATVTANFDLFEAGHVGAHFIFEVEGFSGIEAWEPQVRSDPLTVDVSTRRSNGRVYLCVEKKGATGSAYTGTVEPTHTSGEEWDGSGQIIFGTTDDLAGVKWRYLYDRFGIGKITAVADAQNATVEVTRALPDLGAEGSHKWAHACFSDAEGWPHLVDVWGQRLIFWKDVELAASVTGDYFNFAPIDEEGTYAPDMAFRRRLDVADPPIWSHADKAYLLAGSASGELVVGQINSAAGLSSDNLRADPQSSYGSASTWPQPIGTSILFVQRGGRKIREAGFNDGQGRFVGANINTFTRHITRSGIKWLTFQQEPESVLWCGRNDGTLIAHPHNPEQEVKGFSRIALGGGGTVLAGVSIPSTAGDRDDLWILAQLGNEKMVMQLAEWWDEDSGLERADAFFVDFGASYDGNAKGGDGNPLGPRQEFTSGLSHLEGRQVRVLADGIEYNDLSVAGGKLTLRKPATKVAVGLGYQAKIKLLRAEIRGAGTTMQGMRKRIVRLFARLIDSASPIILNRRGEPDRFFDRKNNLPMDTAAPLFNGDTDDKAVGAGSDYDEPGEIVSDDALPSIISMLVPTYELEELKS